MYSSGSVLVENRLQLPETKFKTALSEILALGSSGLPNQFFATAIQLVNG